MSFVDGISYNTECRGLLSLNSSLSSILIKTEKITDYYHVEQTPFASCLVCINSHLFFVTLKLNISKKSTEEWFKMAQQTQNLLQLWRFFPRLLGSFSTLLSESENSQVVPTNASNGFGRTDSRFNESAIENNYWNFFAVFYSSEESCSSKPRR
ncbi:hypothetical protein ACFE04_019556 [Oxalis oulophora]